MAIQPTLCHLCGQTFRDLTVASRFGIRHNQDEQVYPMHIRCYEQHIRYNIRCACGRGRDVTAYVLRPQTDEIILGDPNEREPISQIAGQVAETVVGIIGNLAILYFAFRR